MRASPYRDVAAECLAIAQDPNQAERRELRLSMALAWLSLARRQEEAEGEPDPRSATMTTR